jgi:predicted  nucleic acid-binding Zn-ribbon protein
MSTHLQRVQTNSGIDLPRGTKRSADTLNTNLLSETDQTIEDLQSKMNYHGSEIRSIRSQINAEKAPEVIAALRFKELKHMSEFYLSGRNLERIKKGDLQNKVDELEKNVEAVTKKAKKDLESFYVQKDELRSIIDTTLTKLDEEKKINSALNQANIDVKKGNALLSRRHENTKKAYGQVKTKLTSAKATLVELTSSLEKAAVENRILKDKLAASEARNAKFISRLDAIAKFTMGAAKTV